MVDIPGDLSTSATITVGGTVTNTLEVNADHDWFRIDLAAGQAITVTLNGVTLEDPYLRIRDASGAIVYENDDVNTGVNLNSALSFAAGSAGAYYIDVGSYGDSGTGDYQVNVASWTQPPLWTNDQIVEQLTSGYWGDGPHSFQLDASRTISVNLTALDAGGQNLARTALSQWSSITGITFSETSGSAQITFDDSEEGAYTDSSYSNGVIASSFVNIDTQWLADYGSNVGSYAYQAYLHEIGHALGLGHAGNYNTTATYPYDALFRNDAWSTSVMSYFSQSENTYFAGQNFDDAYLVTPMVADILAMEQLYGLSTTTRSGNTVYGFHSNAGNPYNASLLTNVAYTIFDTGGIDTMDYSQYATNQRIDLNPESFSDVGNLDGNVSIARGTIIENAIGGSARDVIIGNSVANILTGGTGNDTLTGGAGNDSFQDTAAGLNGDTITDFGVGDKIIIIDASLAGFTFNLTGNTLNFTDGSLTLSGSITGTITASAAAGGGVQLTVQSSAGDDLLTSGPGVDSLDGGDGSDLYMIPSAANHPSAEIHDTGTVGTDEVRFSATGSAQTLTMYAGDTGIERIVIGTGTGTAAVITGLLAHNIDARAVLNGLTIIGNSGANTLQATAYADQLSGGNGVDRLYGFAGNDTLDGGREADVMYGGTGDDTYIVDHASDAPIEKVGEGTDLVLASVAHTLKANVENLTQTGIYSILGRGNDLANIITGNSGSNRLFGEGGNDTLIGNDGTDRLDGGAGNDVLIGGTGNDTYYVDSVGDSLTENAGEGRDTVEATLSWTLGDDLDWLVLAGSSNIDGTGNELANVIRGNGGDNVLSGLGGNDKIYAGAGNDTVDGGNGGDWLEGGAGIDVYTGGTGSDRFVFREGDFGGNTTGTADVITDFGDAEGDRIHLSVVDANSTLAGNQAFHFVGLNAFTGTAGELRYEQISGNTYVSGDINGDGIADFMIRVNGLHTLATDDFVF